MNRYFTLHIRDSVPFVFNQVWHAFADAQTGFKRKIGYLSINKVERINHREPLIFSNVIFCSKCNQTRLMRKEI